ncbi:MAG: prepilin peptidase [Hyphomicrobiaceae bacterium]
MLELVLLTVFPGVVAFAGAMDLFTMTIPNRVSLALVVAFLVLAPLSGFGMEEMASHFLAGLLVLTVGIVMFALGWFGGGDAKLLAAVALWVGFDSLFAYILYVAVAGGVLVELFLLFRNMPLPRAVIGENWAHRLHKRDGGIPYGIALAAGALLVYPYTAWFAHLAG